MAAAEVAEVNAATDESAADAAVTNDVGEALEEGSGGGNVLVIAVVALAVALLVGVVFVILSARRSTT